MSGRNTIIRTLHDLGAAAWFGGSLMGAVGLNGAAAAVKDPHDRGRVASVGWAKWSPVNAAAIGAHVIGGAGILYANRGLGAPPPGAGRWARRSPRAKTRRRREPPSRPRRRHQTSPPRNSS
jgi:hypothetical protein